MRHLNSILRPICSGISAYWGMHTSQVLLDFTNNLYSGKIFLNLHLLTKTCDSKYEFSCPFLILQFVDKLFEYKSQSHCGYGVPVLLICSLLTKDQDEAKLIR